MTAFSIALACTFVAVAQPAEGGNDEPLRVRVHLPRGTHYVGESLDVTVTVLAESERPVITIPRSGDFTMSLVDTSLQRVSATGIGDLVSARNLFRYHYRMIARRAGELHFPALKARASDLSGASQPTTLKVNDPPLAHRPKAFLGGVGPFDVTAEAVPAAVRLGQSLEYRIRLTGPAASASRSVPTLALPGKIMVQPEVEVLAPEEVAEPPSRIFRFRLRPTLAGEAVLPPVPVAAFDPRSERYITKLAPGVPIRVADVATVGEDALTYGQGAGTGGGSDRGGRRNALGYAGLALIALALAFLWRVARHLGSKVDRAREAAARRARDMPVDGAPAELACWINEGLTEYLVFALNRPPGALTPAEVEAAIVAVLDDGAWAERAHRLVEACDRVLYGRAAPPSIDLAIEARALFSALAERAPGIGALRKTKRGSPDREEG